MFLFQKLYLAHLIADFILQFEELYQLKLRSKLGHLGHVVIHLAVSLVLVLPFLGDISIWAAVLLITAIHYFQDNIKYSLQSKHPQQTFWYFTIDQVIHILVVAIIFLFPAGRAVPEPQGTGTLAYLYYDSAPTLTACLFILATFGGSYFLHSIRKSFIPGSRPDHLITNLEMLHGLIERTLVAFAFTFSDSPACWASVLFVGTLRLPFPKLRGVFDFTSSFLFATTLGLLFRLWL